MQVLRVRVWIRVRVRVRVRVIVRIRVRVRVGLGLGFNYIRMILKGCEETPNTVNSPFIIVPFVICARVRVRARSTVRLGLAQC